MAAFTIPSDTEQRIKSRVDRVSADLFAILDDVREHGGTYVSIVVQRPGSTEQIQLILADAAVTVKGQ